MSGVAARTGAGGAVPSRKWTLDCSMDDIEAGPVAFGSAVGGPCPDGPHRGPQGPNEDLSQCPRCLLPSWSLRPPGETMGLHADDCSLPERHESYCVGGGSGHPPAAVVRGFWPGMEDEIAAARARHAHQEDGTP